jgi:transposase
LEGEIRRDLGEDGRAEMVRSIPGVGEILAHALLSEIGEIERFANGRALAAYAGVLPLSRESAEKDYGQRTNRACNRFLRWAGLEAVMGAVRSSPRMASLHARVKAKNPKQPGKARVAVAREILEVVHLLLSKNQRYEERPPSRPGSETRRNDVHRASQTPLCARPRTRRSRVVGQAAS